MCIYIEPHHPLLLAPYHSPTDSMRAIAAVLQLQALWPQSFMPAAFLFSSRTSSHWSVVQWRERTAVASSFRVDHFALMPPAFFYQEGWCECERGVANKQAERDMWLWATEQGEAREDGEERDMDRFAAFCNHI